MSDHSWKDELLIDFHWVCCRSLLVAVSGGQHPVPVVGGGFVPVPFPFWGARVKSLGSLCQPWGCCSRAVSALFVSMCATRSNVRVSWRSLLLLKSSPELPGTCYSISFKPWRCRWLFIFLLGRKCPKSCSAFLLFFSPVSWCLQVPGTARGTGAMALTRSRLQWVQRLQTPPCGAAFCAVLSNGAVGRVFSVWSSPSRAPHDPWMVWSTLGRWMKWGAYIGEYFSAQLFVTQRFTFLMCH